MCLNLKTNCINNRSILSKLITTKTHCNICDKCVHKSFIHCMHCGKCLYKDFYKKHYIYCSSQGKPINKSNRRYTV